MKHIITYNIFESNIFESSRHLSSDDKIIFLDIDGVLRPINSYMSSHQSTFVGAYLVAKNITKPQQYSIKTCSNKECSDQ